MINGGFVCLEQQEKKGVRQSEVPLSKVKEELDVEAKRGGPIQLKILTYHPPTRKFNFQPPTIFRPQNQSGKILRVEIDLGAGKIHTFDVDVTTKILVKSNNIDTSLMVGALQNVPKLQVAYIENYGKPEIVYKPIKRVYDPADEARKNPKPAPQVDAKKKGRPKKVQPQPQLNAVPVYDLFRLDTGDGSLFVCDHVILK